MNFLTRMDPGNRFVLGLAAGGVSGGITYAIIQTSYWWLIVGAIVAIFIWFGELIIDAIF